MMGVRKFSVLALSIVILVVYSGIVYSDKYEELMQDTIDELVQDLADRYAVFEPDEFWHPYVYGTGNENREVMHVQKVERILIEGYYFQWKYARLGLKHFIIGLSNNSFDLFGSDFRKISSTESADGLEALAVYTRWNDEHNHPELIILTVTTEPRLNVYQFEQQTKTMENVGSFPLHYEVKDIEFCRAASSTKVIIIPKQPDVDIDIYNVDVSNTTQVWFFQRIPAPGTPNVAVYDSDILESIIAVAVDTHIDIYNYDSKAGLFDVYQTMKIPNPCRDLFSFTLSYQHYIGCVPLDPDLSVRFVYYNHNTNEYVLEDEDDTFGNLRAVDVYPVAVADYRDEYLLLVQDKQGLTHILMYHGRQAGYQIEYTCKIEDGCPELVDLTRGIGFPYNESTAYVFPGVESIQKSEVYLIMKEVRDSLSPIVAESRKLYNNFYDLSKRFEDWERGVMGVSNAINKSLRSNEPNTVTRAWDLTTLSSPYVKLHDDEYDDARISSNAGGGMEIFEEFKFVGEPWTEKDFKSNVSGIAHQLNALSNNVSFAQQELKDAVILNSESVQLIQADQKILGKFQSSNLTSSDISSPSLVDFRDTEEFLNSLLIWSDKLHIHSAIEFLQLLKVSDLNTSEINEIQVSDIARLTEENVFECPLQFLKNFIVNGSLLTATMNGMNLSDELVTINDISDFHFLEGFVIRNNTTSDGLYSFDNVLLDTSDQVVLSHINFTQLHVNTNVSVGLIDAYNFTDFASSVITNDYSNVITGKKTIAEAVDTNLLNITASWNYLSFPSSFIRTEQKKAVIKSFKSFQSIQTDKVIIVGKLDDVEPNLFVSSTSPMELNSTWTFLGPAKIINDISVSGTVDDVHMEELTSRGTLDEYRDSYVAYADVEFEQEIVVETLFIKFNINNQQFSDVFGDLMLFNGSHCEIPGLTTITTNMTLDNLFVDSGVINDSELNNFLSLNDDQNITANIILNGTCRFGVLCALDLYDTVDLQNLLHNTVRLTGVSKVPWKTNFEHILCGANMNIDGPINSISTYNSSVAVTSGRESQLFISGLSFQKLVLNNLVVEGNILSVGNNLGGIDVNSWDSKRLSLSKDEQITYQFNVEGLVKASSAVYVNSINDVNLLFLSNYTLRTDNPDQTFTEHIRTENTLTLNNGIITFEEELSGHLLDELVDTAFPLNASNTSVLQLDGDWYFEAIKVSSSFIVEGKTCGVDLNALNSDGVRHGDSGITITGKNIFNTAEVEKSIIADTINEKNSDDIFTLNGAQSISCLFNFYKNVSVSRKLATNGELNNIPTASLKKAYSNDQGNVHVIDGDYKSQYIMEMESLRVQGDIQKNDFSDLIKNLIFLDAVNLTFSEMKTFSTLVNISGNVDTLLYNNIRPQDLSTMKLSDDAVLKYPIFKGSVDIGVIEVSSGDVFSKHVNKILWDDLIQQTIQKDNPSSQQYLKNLNFDNILVHHSFNVTIFQGHPFSEYVTLNENQKIKSLKIKKAVFHERNIPINGLVNGFNLTKELEETFMKNSEASQEVTGKKSFVGSVIITNDLNCFGPQFKNQVIDITQAFNISSPIEFLKPLHVDKSLNVSEPVHGYTVDSIMSEALTQGDSQPITGEWDFIRGVTFKDDVSGPGQLENYNVQGLIDKANIQIRAAEEDILRHKQRYREECYKIFNLTEDLISNPMKLDSFDKQQSIILRKKVEKVLTISIATKLYLLTASSSCEIVMYEWKHSTELFHRDISLRENGLQLGHVKEWESATHSHFAFLVFTVKNSVCSSLPMGIHFLFLYPSGKFSTVYPLLVGDIKTFKLICDTEAKKCGVFVINNDNRLSFFTWNEEQSVFIIEHEMTFKNTYDRIELAIYKNGIGVLLVSDSEVSIYHYDWTMKTISLLGKEHFLTGMGRSLGIFESYDALYGIVPQKGNQFPNLLASCTVNVFRALDSEMHQLQQLPLQELVSLSVMNFARQTYITFLSKTLGLSIYKFMGLNGLQLLNTNPIKIFNGYQVHSFDVKTWKYSASRPFLLVLTDTAIEVFHGNVYGDSISFNSNNLCRVK